MASTREEMNNGNDGERKTNEKKTRTATEEVNGQGQSTATKASRQSNIEKILQRKQTVSRKSYKKFQSRRKKQIKYFVFHKISSYYST